MLNAAVVIVWSSACESYVDMASFGLRHKCVSGKCHLHGLSCMLCVSHDKHLSTHFTTSCDVTTSITVMSMNQTFSQKLIVPKPLPPMTTKSSFHFSLFFLSNRSGTMDAESLQAICQTLHRSKVRPPTPGGRRNHHRSLRLLGRTRHSTSKHF